MIFEKYNKNPRNIKSSDCVVRAIATALNQSWLQTYNDLCKIKNLIKSLLDSKNLRFLLFNKKLRINKKNHKNCYL